jgi:hypothetical protein
MRIRITRARATAAVLCGTAAIATAACSAPAPATATAMVAAATATPIPTPTVTVTATPVIVDCAVTGQRRPAQYPLTCTGTSTSLAGLQWANWGPSAAFAVGRIGINDCVPSCVGGTGHSFPVLVTLWRAEPRPGHRGKSYFTRMTVIYTGSHSYRAGRKLVSLPATITYPLSPGGGGA